MDLDDRRADQLETEDEQDGGLVGKIIFLK
jgi:hypothetical protein